MTSLSYCQQKLRDQYNKNPKSTDNISRFMTKAWGNERSECFAQFGRSITRVKSFVNNLKSSNYTYHWVANFQTTNKTTNLQTTTVVKQDNQLIMELKAWIIKFARWIAIIFLIITIRAFFKYIFEFLYDVSNAKRLIYMKVLQTRQDTKSDREVQKELAKDMKEKIWRMTQVYNNLHKLWKLWVWDIILQHIFNKPKIVLIYNYEKGRLNFIVWTYPEYRSILEWAISAQYSSASMEIVEKPKFFCKKYSDVMPLEPIKEPAYCIKTYKHLPDDPINNIIDSIWKISIYDNVNIVMPLKPAGENFNKRAKKLVDAIYRKDKKAMKQTKWREYFVFPRKIIDFFINWPSKELLYHNDNWTVWDKMVRMVKSQENAYNSMWEEAALPAFEAGLLLTTTSDQKENVDKNIDVLLTAYNIFNDEYLNKLQAPQRRADLFWFIFKPLRKFAANFAIPSFFFKKNIFALNSLASLRHLPDWMYNRSPIISWMEYKMLAPPDNLPVFKNENWFIMSWIVAEKFKWWKLTEILKDSKHRAVWVKEVKEDIREPIEKFSEKEIEWKEIIEKDWRKFVKSYKTKKVRWYKLYHDWVLLWVNIYRNKFSPVYFKRDDRTRHHYCIWKSWTWKSVYLQTIARQDVRNWDWICVIDPHGDLVDDMLEFIPKERAKDVIVFDAWDDERPMWLNLYEIDNIDEADRTVNDATEMFIKMFWPEIFWPRIQEYFKFWSLTLLEDFDDRPTLLDVPRLFTDETYREYKTRNIKNPVVRNFREKTYNAMWDREKQEIIPYFTSKFVSFNTNRLIRNIIWQTKSAFKLDDVMNNQKILLVSLSKWKIWDMNAQLLWMILVSKIYTAAMARAKIPKEERKDFYLYVDEFQNFVSATFADILSEARKYRLCLIMAHQYIKQLEAWKWLWDDWWWKWDVKAAVFWNCWTIQSFKVWAPDAETLEKEYAPVLWAQDIVWIANYKAYIKLNINNSTTRVFSMNSIYTMDYRSKKIAWILREYSRKKYWRKRKFVDAEIQIRLWLWEENNDNQEAKEVVQKAENWNEEPAQNNTTNTLKKSLTLILRIT